MHIFARWLFLKCVELQVSALCDFEREQTANLRRKPKWNRIYKQKLSREPRFGYKGTHMLKVSADKNDENI